MIGANDLFIAAQAQALDRTQVTNNTAEFERVKGLEIENWMLPNVARSEGRPPAPALAPTSRDLSHPSGSRFFQTPQGQSENWIAQAGYFW